MLIVVKTTANDADIILIDFGCAKKVEDAKEYKDLVGTVYYLAPELAAQSSRVHKTGKILKRVDIWSIGVIAFVMLTGRPPFKVHLSAPMCHFEGDLHAPSSRTSSSFRATWI